MNTKILMSISAILMGAAGIILSFLPQEVSTCLSLTGTKSIVLQLLGALYFAFAMLNQAARANLTGGIYSKPVTVANFTHFLIGGLALDKMAVNNMNSVYIWIAGSIYSVFAILFGYVLFTIPVLKIKAV